MIRSTFEQYARPGESFDNEAHRIAVSDRKLADDWTFYKGDVRKVAAAYIGGRGAVLADGTIREDRADALGTTPKAYAEQVAAILGAVRQSALNSAIAGPNGALDEAIKNPEKPIGDPVVDALPLDQKIKVLRSAQTQAHQGNAQARGAMAQTIGDVVASLEHGQTPPNVPSPQDMIVALGPVDGMKAAFVVEQAKLQQQLISSFQTMPATDILDKVKASEPTPGPGAELAWKRQENVSKAANEVIRQREQNPAGIVLQGNAATRQLFDAVANAKTPEERATASQAYATSTLSEQTRLQIQKPSILTPQMVTQIAQQFAVPAAPNTKNVIDGMADQWGSHFSMVMRELSKSIPHQAITIALGMKPEAAEMLSEGSKMKPEELRKGVVETDVKTAEDAISKALAPAQATMAFQNGGAETYAAYSESAKTLTLMLMKQGVAPKDAAQQAVEGMLNFKYAYSGNIRVPKTVLGGGVSVPAIEQGARASLRDVVESTPLMLPSVMVAGVTKQDAMAQWKETVKSNGMWLTSPGNSRDFTLDNGGLTLHYKSGMGAQVVLDANGKEITRTWRELADIGQAYTAAFYPNPQNIIGGARVDAK